MSKTIIDKHFARWIQLSTGHLTGSRGDIKRVLGSNTCWYFYSPLGVEFGPYSDKEACYDKAEQVFRGRR